MEFASMKRRELLELCRQHGLATRGSKADLAASLAGAISGAAAAGAAESVVEVVVGKGCLKRLGGSASGDTFGAAKKVRFALDEESEERARRRRSQVILQPVVTKTRGRRKARKIHPAAAVSGRGQRNKCNDVSGDSTDKDVTGEAGADAPVTRSTMKAMCLCAHSGAESQNNSAEAEKEGEVVEAAIDRKQRWKIQENAMVIAANSHEGISRRTTQSSSSSSAAVLVCPVEKKRGRRKERDVKDDLGAEELAAQAQDLITSESLVIIKSRSSRNGEYYPPSAQKSPKVVVSCRTRSSSLAATVNVECTAANALAGVSNRSTRKSSLPASAVVENKRGRRKVVDHKGELGVEEQAAQVQDLATAVSPVVENGRNRGKGEDCVPVMQKSGRTARAHSVAAAAMLPIVTGNKVTKAEDVHSDGLPAELDFPQIDAPVTRSLRNRIVQVYNSVVEETHVGEKLENKRKLGRPSTRKHQQLASSVTEEKQVAAPRELPPLKHSMRNRAEVDELSSNANLGTNKLCRLPVAKDLKILHPLALHTTNTSVEDVVAEGEKETGFTKSSSEYERKNAGGVSSSVDHGNKASAAKTELGVLDESTTGMHESVSGMDFQNAKGRDVGKQPAVREPVRRSTRRCVAAGRI